MQQTLFLLAVVLLITAAVATTTTNALREDPPLSKQPPFVVNTKTNRLVDMYGRERYTHGTNVVSKAPPYHPDVTNWNPNTSFVQRDMIALEELGINSMRLGVMWPGVMPQPGVINHSYINVMQQLVSEAADQYGIVSLLDAHQDTGAAKFCGEGIPDWAAHSNCSDLSKCGFPWPIASPWNRSVVGEKPSYEQCHEHGWANYYFSYQVSSMFYNLYKDNFGMLTAFEQSWSAVASAFKGAGASVLGFELLNEPFSTYFSQNKKSGKAELDPLMLIPGLADGKLLQPAWNRLAKKIRAIDNEHCVFVEGITWDWLGPGWKNETGNASYLFSKYADRTVLAMHFYEPPDVSLSEFDYFKKKAEELGVGYYLTEFGISHNPTADGSLPQKIFDKVDSTLSSGWMFWEYKPFQSGWPGHFGRTGHAWSIFNPDGSYNAQVAKGIARTYAMIVAGITQSMSFNHTTGEFQLVFKKSAQVTNPESVIYYSDKYHYFGGLQVAAVASNGAQVNYTVSNYYVRVITPASLPPSGTVSVVMRRYVGDKKNN